jgi:hypothetical protein
MDTTTTATKTDSELLEIYMDSLDDINRKALDIAKEQLQSSFSIEKSIGFIEWKKSYYNTNNTENS